MVVLNTQPMLFNTHVYSIPATLGTPYVFLLLAIQLYKCSLSLNQHIQFLQSGANRTPTSSQRSVRLTRTLISHLSFPDSQLHPK